MVHTLMAKNSRANDYTEAFGEELTILEYIQGINGADRYHGIPAGQSQSVLFKPSFGMLNKPKYLTLKKMGGLSIELESNDDYLDAIINPNKTVLTDVTKKTYSISY